MNRWQILKDLIKSAIKDFFADFSREDYKAYRQNILGTQIRKETHHEWYN